MSRILDYPVWGEEVAPARWLAGCMGVVAIVETTTVLLGRVQRNFVFLALFFDCVGLFSLFFRFLAKFRPNLGLIRYKSPTQSQISAIFLPFLIPRA